MHALLRPCRWLCAASAAVAARTAPAAHTHAQHSAHTSTITASGDATPEARLKALADALVELRAAAQVAVAVAAKSGKTAAVEIDTGLITRTLECVRPLTIDDLRPQFSSAAGAPSPATAGRSVIRFHALTPPEDTALGVVIFRLPEGAVMPVHNHPSIHVVTKVLEGNLRVVSFKATREGHADADSTNTIALGAHAEGERVRLTCTSNNVLRAGDVALTLPTRDNIHAFHAERPDDAQAPTAACVLDVLAPTYDDAVSYTPQRPCNYYYPIDGPAGRSPGWPWDAVPGDAVDARASFYPPASYECEQATYEPPIALRHALKDATP